MNRRRKARYIERSREEIAVVNGEADALPGIRVEIGMRDSESLGLRGGRITEAIDVMVAVTFGMGDADEGTERKVLLQGEARLAGQVLAGHEESFAGHAPFRRARRVDDGLVKPFAGFRRDAVIAKRPCRRKRVVGIVGFVDDEATRSERAERRQPRNIARHWLLDIEQPG